jgi:hypothetical protein
MKDRDGLLLRDLVALASLRALRREAEARRLRLACEVEAANIEAHRAQAGRLIARSDAMRRGGAGCTMRMLFDGLEVLSDRAASAQAAARDAEARLEHLRSEAHELSHEVARQEERMACYRRMLADPARGRWADEDDT